MKYKIESVGPEKTVQGKYGELKIYQVKFAEETDWVEISQKTTTPPPVVGQEVEGTIESSQYGKRFKKDFQQRGGFAGGGNSSKIQAAAILMAGENGMDYAKAVATVRQLEASFNNPSIFDAPKAESTDDQPPVENYQDMGL